MASPSTVPDFTVSPAQASVIAAALGKAGVSNVSVADLATLHNMSSITFDGIAYGLTNEETGCARPGALPVALAFNDTCLPGWYCPNSDDQNPPQFCHPTEKCSVQRNNRQTCGGPQGFLEPYVCNPGWYCPPGGKKKFICPKGTFCPTGSFQPWNCTFGSLCPEGSQRQLNVLPVALVSAIDFVLIVLVLSGLGIAQWRKRRPKQYTTIFEPSENADNVKLLNAAGMPARARSPSLMLTTPEMIELNPSHQPARRSPRMSLSGPDPYDSDAPIVASRISNLDGGESGLPQWSPGFDSSYGDDESMMKLNETELAAGDDSHDNPDFQRFIRSMARTIETNSIGLSFDFENLTYQTKKGKKILQDVTGTMPRGSCWGIMGGSGAGKSTFLNVLMGKATATSGSIKINGWNTDMSKYKKLIGYVPQDDIVFPELTVRENILHSARVRLPASWKDKAIQDHVDSLIACLQLTHVQHSRVGDSRKPVISGGQRKRVNIGMELAAAPMAIFLDEPTSGLDATSAASIMRLLRAISRLGVTTIAIIHQPREQIFYGFDQLLLLARGRSVYSGPTYGVQGYFESIGFMFPQQANPADTLMDIVTGDGAQYSTASNKQHAEIGSIINEWNTRGQYSSHQRHLSSSFDPEASKRMRRISNQSMTSIHSTVEQEANLVRTMKARGATWPAQVYYCFKRAMTQQVRNSTSFLFEIAVGALAGIVIGLSAFASNGHLFQGIYQPPFVLLSSAVDYSSTPQLGLLGAMAIGLAASAPGFWVFGEEKLMYWRETASGHSRSAYYVGKLLSTLLRIGLSSLHFTVFLGVLATPLMPFSKMYAVNAMYFWCIYGLASIVSMFVKREDGPLISVLASLIIGVLGGVAPPLSKVKQWHMVWLWRSSPGVWFTESYFNENLQPLGYLYILDLAAEALGFTLGQYWLDVTILAVIGVIYRAIAYLLLITIHRDKQR